jgi:hypothetical protein
MRSIALFACLAVLEVHAIDANLVGISPQSRREAPMKDHPFVGSWVANFSKSKLHPSFQYRSVTLEIAVSGENVTMTGTLVDEAGREQRAAETLRTDGTESPGILTPGVTHIARWLGPDVLASIARKDGHTIGLVTYEVSADRRTLTSRSSGLLEQVIVFDRQ